MQLPGTVVEVAEYSWEAPTNAVHCYPDHTLGLALSPLPTRAEACYLYGNEPKSLKAIGPVSLAVANLPYRIRSLGGTHRTVSCRFAQDRFEAITRHGKSWAEPELEMAFDLRCTPIAQTLRRLANELLDPGFASDVLADSYSTAILVELSRYLRVVRTSRIGPRDGVRLSAYRLRLATEFIEENYWSVLTVGVLADLCGLSRRHFARSFGGTTGQKVSEYVGQVRLRKAIELLSDTNLSLKEITYKVGFSSPSNFSQAFRKITGESPTTFKSKRR
jgi:AraC family transcriptional regulator